MSDEDSQDLIREYFRKLGRKGGKVGGRRRAENMTPAQHSAWGAYMVKRREARRAEKKAAAEATTPERDPDDSLP